MTITRQPLRAMTGIVLGAAVVAGLAACRANEVPRTFKTPEQAVEALSAALEKNDPKEVEVLFGEGSLPVLRSGDQVADKQDVERVRGLIKETVAFEDVDDHTKVASFGKDPWPFPFPLVSDKGRWHFDLQGGIEELHNRRIGRNELSTLATLHAYVDAQREYWAAKPMGDPPQFAQKFRSDEGTKNGLYWATAEGEEPSPLGDLVAAAEVEGYAPRPAPAGATAAEPATAGVGGGAPAADGEAAKSGDSAATGGAVPAGVAAGSGGTTAAAADAADNGPRTFHGYKFRILTAQGKNAAPGERSYIDKDGHMTGGFAAVAWPASYGNSGIMTFLVNTRGIVFQKDLGAETPTAVQAITIYDPDLSWLPTGD